MAQLAIQGHRMRGREVIALLEMLGGKNKRFFNCARQTCIYFIGDDNDISMLYLSLANENFVVFTIEEFETKFPYKVGNKVTYDGWDCTVIGMEWENNTNTILYTVKGIDFCKCACVEDLHSHKEEKTYPPYMDYDVTTKEQPKELLIGMIKDKNGDWELNTHKDYEIKEVDGKFKLIKKQSKYPKTYAECCEVLGVCADDCFSSGYKCSLLTEFQELIICLDAYWKIAGEEMGLGKPWEPDWSTEGDIKYVIEVYRNNVRKNSQGYSNTILAFPTAEMRNAFYENFNELIEQCKEFL